MRNLRQYQREAYNEIFAAWETDDILMYVLATGGGKTVIFVEIIRELLLRHKRPVLAAHRQELIHQAARTLMVQEIDCGIIMASIPMQAHKPVQVCSVQTLARRQQLPPADYYIFDEGHHAQMNNMWGKQIKQAVNNGAKILLVTATPYRLSGDGFEFLHDYKKTRLILGKSLKWLQDEGWLVPLRYLVASVADLSKVRLKSGEYDEAEAAEIMQLAPIVDSYLEHVPGKIGCCFTVNIKHSINTVNKYLIEGVPAAHLDANTPDEERKKIISDLKCGLIKVVSNVGIITEGFDFPNLDFVQLATPTKSLSKYLQMVGRVTRSCIDIDMYDSKERRKYEIAKSAKPHGLILDNANCWMDHNLPEMEHDWELHFKGLKKLKKSNEELIEMLVFIAEDGNGMRIRTTNPEEIEGMRLVEMTTEQRKKYVNLSCLKDFDKTYFTFNNLRSMQKPGFLAVQDFIKQCAKNNVLMVDEVWDHIRKRCVDDVDEKLNQLALNRAKNMEVYPDSTYHAAIQQITRGRVSRQWLDEEQVKYEQKHASQLREHRLKKTA